MRADGAAAAREAWEGGASLGVCPGRRQRRSQLPGSSRMERSSRSEAASVPCVPNSEDRTQRRSGHGLVFLEKGGCFCTSVDPPEEDAHRPGFFPAPL
ncbi:hypothetical protein NDU88_003994 [Pleurodeles waltl]|uniref:Uncharacterized protein n=1 Tax=Pleurodeles waltl TaxID=8319 RepID=A0AAV7QAZ5_PLEWA|nr:hypothetical protein NDU88_003994 [Pleurodeles waltl]